MYYKDKSGEARNTHLLGGKAQERMTKNGWRLRQAISCRETAQEMYDRLSREYSQVKIYEGTTRIRGYHDIFALCK